MARELKGEKLEKELLRLEEMKAYEKENAAYQFIPGILFFVKKPNNY